MVLGTAVVGAGVVSATHLSGLAKNPRVELAAICDLDQERAREAANEYRIASYTEFDELLATEELDWIHVCTPVQTHLDLATRAIEAGVPVLIEKPVTETLAELEELVETAERHGIRASVVHNLLYTPAVRKARKAIHQGRLGSVRGVDIVYTDMTGPDEPERGSWAFDLPGGEFEEGLPHPIYTTLGVGGYPASAEDICATTALRNEYERDFSFDEAAFQYVTDDGTICSATMRGGAIPQRFFTVHGEQASMFVDLLSQTVIDLHRNYSGSPVTRALNNLDHTVGRIAGTAESVALFGRNTLKDDWESQKASQSHYALFDEEIEAITGQSDPSNGLERARWSMTILEAIRDASGRRVDASPSR